MNEGENISLSLTQPGKIVSESKIDAQRWRFHCFFYHVFKLIDYNFCHPNPLKKLWRNLPILDVNILLVTGVPRLSLPHAQYFKEIHASPKWAEMGSNLVLKRKTNKPQTQSSMIFILFWQTSSNEEFMTDKM